MPPATLKPLLPSMLSGCSEIELPKPPNSTFAPTPTPTLALPVAPTSARQQTRPGIVGRRKHRPSHYCALHVSYIDPKLLIVPNIMLRAAPPAAKVQLTVRDEPNMKMKMKP